MENLIAQNEVHSSFLWNFQWVLLSDLIDANYMNYERMWQNIFKSFAQILGYSIISDIVIKFRSTVSYIGRHLVTQDLICSLQEGHCFWQFGNKCMNESYKWSEVSLPWSLCNKCTYFCRSEAVSPGGVVSYRWCTLY